MTTMTEQEQIRVLREALENIAQPANAGCGCDFPCRCDTTEAEAINAGAMRDIAGAALAATAAIQPAAPEPKAWLVGLEVFRTLEQATANVRNPDLTPQPLYTAAPAQAAMDEALEKIAESWDGCMYDAPGAMLDIGASLREQFADLRTSAAQAAQADVRDAARYRGIRAMVSRNRLTLERQPPEKLDAAIDTTLESTPADDSQHAVGQEGGAA